MAAGANLSDFFERQDLAKRNTRLLAFWMLVAVLMTALAMYLVIVATLWPFHDDSPPDDVVIYGPMPDYSFVWYRPRLFMYVVGITLSMVFIASFAKLIQMRRGGAAVAEALEAVRVDPETKDPRERQLINVVAEVSLASQLPEPPIYILDNESTINSFAAGYSPESAIIGVTRGALEQLTRYELQAVIAHEFSHIINGDMRVHTRLVGILYGIMFIAESGQELYQAGEQLADAMAGHVKVPGLIIMAFACIPLAIGQIGLTAARLVKSAVCRQREFLADSVAVQYTRHPDALTSALRKVGGSRKRSGLASTDVEEFGHLFFAGIISQPWLPLLETHPSLTDRIRRFESHFDGQFSSTNQTSFDESKVAPSENTPQHDPRWGQLIKAVPDACRELLRDPEQAQIAVYSLLLRKEENARRKQLRLFEQRGATIHQSLATFVQSQPRQIRLPLLEAARAALSRLPVQDFESFASRVEQLVTLTEPVTAFDLAVRDAVVRDFQELSGPSRREVQFHALQAVLHDVTQLLSCVAHLGTRDDRRAAQAVAKAAAEIGEPSAKVRCLDRSQTNLTAAAKSLQRIARSSPGLRELVMSTALACAKSDGRVTANQADFLYWTAMATGSAPTRVPLDVSA